MSNYKPIDFYSFKIELNTIIDKFEESSKKMTSSELSEQIKLIEKKIQDLNKLSLDSQDIYEKDKRLGMSRVILQRFNNVKSNLLMNNKKITEIIPGQNSSITVKIIEEQDKQLDQLNGNIGKLKLIADNIYGEIKDQNNMLTELGQKTDDTHQKMKITTGKINFLREKLKNEFCCKIFIFIVIILVVISVIMVVGNFL